MKETLYLVYYTTGMYGELDRVFVFVTENEDVAKLYCEKFNTLLENLTFYYILKTDMGMGLTDWEDKRFTQFTDIGRAYYKPIEKR